MCDSTFCDDPVCCGDHSLDSSKGSLENDVESCAPEFGPYENPRLQEILRTAKQYCDRAEAMKAESKDPPSAEQWMRWKKNAEDLRVQLQNLLIQYENVQESLEKQNANLQKYCKHVVLENDRFGRKQCAICDSSDL